MAAPTIRYWSGLPDSVFNMGALQQDYVEANMLKGGIYIYPETDSHPHGKLRLQYECNPVAFIVEQAGGTATDGGKRILDIEPQDVHERTPLYVGSRNMVGKVTEFLRFFDNV